MKTCRCCGRTHDAAAWASLVLKGVQPSEDDTGRYELELRDCTCGSTIGIETKVA